MSAERQAAARSMREVQDLLGRSWPSRDEASAAVEQAIGLCEQALALRPRVTARPAGR